MNIAAGLFLVYFVFSYVVNKLDKCYHTITCFLLLGSAVFVSLKQL